MGFSWFSPLILWLLTLQNISETSVPFLATVNPPYLPKNVLLKWSTGHLIPSVAAAKASREFNILQGKRGIWFSEAYRGKLQQERSESSTYIVCTHLDPSRTMCIQRDNKRIPNICFSFKCGMNIGSLRLVNLL